MLTKLHESRTRLPPMLNWAKLHLYLGPELEISGSGHNLPFPNFRPRNVSPTTKLFLLSLKKKKNLPPPRLSVDEKRRKSSPLPSVVCLFAISVFHGNSSRRTRYFLALPIAVACSLHYFSRNHRPPTCLISSGQAHTVNVAQLGW